MMIQFGMSEDETVYLERWAHTYILAGTIPNDKRFDMETWGKMNVNSACGTSACLAGHAGLTPWFRREGFKLKGDGQVLETESIQYGLTEDINRFFGIDDMQVTPFEPRYCRDMLQIILGRRLFGSKGLTPKRVQKVVKAYMIARFGGRLADRAISDATITNDLRKKFTSHYNESFIHRHLKWVKELVTAA